MHRDSHTVVIEGVEFPFTAGRAVRTFHGGPSVLRTTRMVILAGSLALCSQNVWTQDTTTVRVKPSLEQRVASLEAYIVNGDP